MTDRTVTPADTASAVGSGDVPCLSTATLIAWLEAESCEVAGPLIGPDETTVGVSMEMDHLAPSPIHGRVKVVARVRESSRSWLDFDVSAVDAVTGKPLARGTLTRAIVNRNDFIARLASPDSYSSARHP